MLFCLSTFLLHGRLSLWVIITGSSAIAEDRATRMSVEILSSAAQLYPTTFTVDYANFTDAFFCLHVVFAQSELASQQLFIPARRWPIIRDEWFIFWTSWDVRHQLTHLSTHPASHASLILKTWQKTSPNQHASTTDRPSFCPLINDDDK